MPNQLEFVNAYICKLLLEAGLTIVSGFVGISNQYYIHINTILIRAATYGKPQNTKTKSLFKYIGRSFSYNIIAKKY